MRVLGTGAEVDAPREGTETDVLGVGAYDNGKLVGLAGCSADCVFIPSAASAFSLIYSSSLSHCRIMEYK